MSDVINLIERYFQSFINEQELYNFFLGLADYIELVYTRPEAKLIIAELEEQRLKEYEKLEVLEKQVLKELQKAVDVALAAQEMYKYLPEVNTAIQRLADFCDDKLDYPAFSFSAHRPLDIQNKLHEIVVANGKQYKDKLDFFKPFVELHPINSNIYGNYTFSPTLAEYKKQIDFLNKNTELWSAWFQLSVVEAVIHSNGQLSKDLINAKRDRTHQQDVQGYCSIFGSELLATSTTGS